jgi:para-nitrobenzyl esterase
VGTKRLSPPEPTKRQAGVIAADTDGPKCPQISTSDGVTFEGQEDCLALNVYRPAERDPSRLLPVLVWIHGGSFDTGSGSDYNPKRLVGTDTIVITINYRLGALGFLAADGLASDYGLMDQQAALDWVQRNVTAFGGDPKLVTIQGQSAGAASVCAHLTLPQAQGKERFSRAIIQSGSCASEPLELAKVESAKLAEQFKTWLGCKPEDLAKCLRDSKTPAATIVGLSKVAGVLYGIVTDSDSSSVLTLAPANVVAEGKQYQVPVLIGDITDEMSLFTFIKGKYQKLTVDDYPIELAKIFKDFKDKVDAIVAEYPVGKYDTPTLAINAVLNDSGVYYFQALGGCVTAWVADAFSRSTTTYAYELDDPNFTWWNGNRGATHTSDLPYLFDLKTPLSKSFEQNQNDLADVMVKAWHDFVHGGAPAEGWPAYSRDKDGKSFARLLKPSESSETRETIQTINLREAHHCQFWEDTLKAPANPDG